MAISFPLALPTVKCAMTVEFRAINAVAIDQSPFAFAQSVHHWGGEMWQADITLPPMDRADAEQWNAFLTSLRGQYGTFLMGDPRGKVARGTATSATLTGALGSASPTVTMTGTLLAGDYFQIGGGADSNLHKVLQDRSGNGTLEIWPALRRAATSAPIYISDPKGVFRLSTNDIGWTIDQLNKYGITLPAMEAI
jgi:hypothetical protein